MTVALENLLAAGYVTIFVVTWRFGLKVLVMLGLHAVGVFPELLLLKAHLGSFCVAARKWGVSMNIPEFKVVISFW